MKRAKRLPPAERRAQLLRAAIGAAEVNGFMAFNHRMVAELAGVSVPTVFNSLGDVSEMRAEALAELTAAPTAALTSPRAYAEAMLETHGPVGAAALLADHFCSVLEWEAT